MREHQYSKRSGHEDKYEWIRSLEAAGTPWYSEIIETVTEDGYFPDAERWHVIRLTRGGHQLMNMRHGSVQQRQELSEQVKAPHIRNTMGVIADRKRRKFQSSKRLHRRIWKRELRTRGICGLESCKVLPEIFQRKLCTLADADVNFPSFTRGLPIEDLVRYVRRTFASVKELRQLHEQCAANLPRLK